MKIIEETPYRFRIEQEGDAGARGSCSRPDRCYPMNTGTWR
jgi:hypothetical protein